jgi:SH3-like domain-containing protein
MRIRPLPTPLLCRVLCLLMLAAGPAAAQTPVVHAHANSHAQKPVAKHKPAAPARMPTAKDLKVPAPTPPPPAPDARPAELPKPPPEKPDPNKGTSTGMPLPRWASLRTDEVNLRAGPGTRYPIEWVYHRRDLPVEIEREFEVWRLVEDQDGVKGWVHQATLIGHHTFVVRNTEQAIRSEPANDASPVAELKPGVVGRIRACAATADWCEVQVGEYRGWIRRDGIWGLRPGEAVTP